MKPMEELTKFLRYLSILSLSSILLFTSCDSSYEVANDVEVIENGKIVNIPLTRDDSVMLLVEELNLDYDPKTENINDILGKIIIQKNILISNLDSLDKRADAMEMAAISYKKKENRELRNQLLSEIERIKAELVRIKELSGISDEIVKKGKTSIPEIKVPDMTSTFENLPAGNYTTRIDKYHLISILVLPNGQIVVRDPVLDSTTVIKGKALQNDRIKKELDQIREKIKRNN